MAKQHTSSQMRGIVKNPNNPAYAADIANRSRLGHPNVPAPSTAAEPQATTSQPEPKK